MLERASARPSLSMEVSYSFTNFTSTCHEGVWNSGAEKGDERVSCGGAQVVPLGGEQGRCGGRHGGGHMPGVRSEKHRRTLNPGHTSGFVMQRFARSSFWVSLFVETLAFLITSHSPATNTPPLSLKVLYLHSKVPFCCQTLVNRFED